VLCWVRRGCPPRSAEPAGGQARHDGAPARVRQDERLGQAPSGEQDALATQDDELDRHAAMLPLVRLIERAAALGAHARAALPNLRQQVLGLQCVICHGQMLAQRALASTVAHVIYSLTYNQHALTNLPRPCSHA